jgi:hypothetical protein
VIDAHAFDSTQVVYNMLNPSAAAGLPATYPAQRLWTKAPQTLTTIGRRKPPRALARGECCARPF